RSPTVVLGVGPLTYAAGSVLRASASTVCAGDKVELNATASSPVGDQLLSFSWRSSDGHIKGRGSARFIKARLVKDPSQESQIGWFDTVGLAPGDYTITVNVENGYGGIASDTKTISVTNCPPLTVGFGPNLDINASATSVDPGGKISFQTSGV